MDTTYNTLGIDPNVQIVGTSKSNNKLLLRGKLNDKTIRYVACYNNDGNFKYFRKVTSTERKRVGKGEEVLNPLEQLDWVQNNLGWETVYDGSLIQTINLPYILAPTDYPLYSVGYLILTSKNLKEII